MATLVFLGAGIGFALPFLSPLLLAGVHRLGPGMIGFLLVPAALTQALVSRTGGRLADGRGTAFLFNVSSALHIGAFVALSTVVGGPPALFACVLIFGNVGQVFMRITLTNTISTTLPAEQTGAGMGLLSMLNFIAGALAAAIYGTVVDLDATSRWNPLNPYSGSAVYSNMYLALAILSVGMPALRRRRFGTRTGGVTPETTSKSAPA